MDSGNAEVVRRAVDAFSRQDEGALIALVHPQVEFRSALAALEGRVYRGHAGARQYMRDMYETWTEWRTSEEDYVDAGMDRVVFTYRIRGRGRASGVPIDRRLAIVFTIEDDTIRYGAVHLDPLRALAVAGVVA